MYLDLQIIVKTIKIIHTVNIPANIPISGYEIGPSTFLFPAKFTPIESPYFCIFYLT
jgi:hypothetical protein